MGFLYNIRAVSFSGLDFINILVGCCSNRLNLLDVLRGLLDGIIIINPLYRAGLDDIKIILNNIRVVLNNIKIRLHNAFIIFLIYFLII